MRDSTGFLRRLHSVCSVWWKTAMLWGSGYLTAGSMVEQKGWKKEEFMGNRAVVSGPKTFFVKTAE